MRNIPLEDKLINFSFNGIYIYDLVRGANVFINQQYTNLTGYTIEDVRDMSKEEFIALFHPDEQEAIAGHMQEVINSELGDIFEIEYRFKKADGNWMWCLSRDGLFDVNEKGEPTQFVGMFIDITEQKLVEQKFKGLLENAPDAVVIVDKKGIIQLVNAQAKNLFGYNRDEMVGQKIEMLIPKRFRKPHAGHRSHFFDHAKKRAMGVGLELLALRKNGEEFRVEISLGPLETHKGLLVSAAIRDVTEKYKTAEKLRQLDRAIDEIEDYSVILLDLKGNIQNWNRGAERINGYSASEIIGKNIRLFYREADKKVNKPDQLLRIAKENGEAMDAGWRVRKDGSRRWCTVTITTIHDESGNVTGFSKITRDLTEQRNTAMKLESKTRETRELEAFSYSVSHDLRAPLRAISGYSQILIEDYYDQLGEEGKEVVNTIVRNTNKMGQLIDDILAFSRLGRKKMTKQKINMNRLFNSIYKELAMDVKGRKIDFHLQELEDIHGDKTMITQLVMNLLSNAIKYTRPRATAMIRVSGQHTDKGYVYSVEDNGVGFNMKYQDKLFGVFQRLHKDKEFEGTGVGLAIAHRVLEFHNGRIWAESEIGGGAIFYFTINDQNSWKTSEK